MNAGTPHNPAAEKHVPASLPASLHKTAARPGLLLRAAAGLGPHAARWPPPARRTRLQIGGMAGTLMDGQHQRSRCSLQRNARYAQEILWQSRAAGASSPASTRLALMLEAWRMSSPSMLAARRRSPPSLLFKSSRPTYIGRQGVVARLSSETKVAKTKSQTKAAK